MGNTVTKDTNEYVEGGILRDQFGRRQMTLRGLHQARATGDALEGGTIVDSDKREQVVVRDINGNVMTSASSSGLPGWFDITASPYNATTGATDNTTAIQTAIDAAKLAGGKVYVPPGIYKYASMLVLDGWEGGGIIGVGDDGGEIAAPKSELRFTGTGSGRGISARSIFGFTFKGILFTYTSTSFTGDLIDIDGGTHAADCTNFSIIGCGSLHKGASITARSIIRMNQAINGIIYDCGWGGGVNTIRLGDPGGAYVVGVKVTNCTFNYANDSHILIGSSDAENIVIDNCRFEASINTTGIKGATTAVDGGNCLCYALQITNNWFGDAGGSVDWIEGLRTIGNGPATISGNYFADCGVAGTHINTDSSAGINLNIFSNVFTSGLNVFIVNVASTVTLMNNHVNTVTNLCNGGGDRPANFIALNNRASGTSVPDTLPCRVALGIGKVSGAFAGTTLTPGATGAQEQLILGASDSATRIVLGKKGGVYTSVGGADSGTHCLNLQAPTDDATRQVALVAGTTPTVRFAADGTGIGFFAVAPIARTAAYTLNAGATSRNLPAAGTVLQVESALRQLITDLQNYGLLQ